MPGYEVDRLTYDPGMFAGPLDRVRTVEDHYDEPLTTINTRPWVPVNGAPYTTDTWTINVPKFVTDKDLEHFSEKIYKVIEEHTTIDISEEEL